MAVDQLGAFARAGVLHVDVDLVERFELLDEVAEINVIFGVEMGRRAGRGEVGLDGDGVDADAGLCHEAAHVGEDAFAQLLRLRGAFAIFGVGEADDVAGVARGRRPRGLADGGDAGHGFALPAVDDDVVARVDLRIIGAGGRDEVVDALGLAQARADQDVRLARLFGCGRGLFGLRGHAGLGFDGRGRLRSRTSSARRVFAPWRRSRRVSCSWCRMLQMSGSL